MISEIISAVFLVAGGFFLTVGVVGIIRLPDFYSRMHALGKCDTFGMLLCLIGIMIYEGFSLSSLKLFYIWVFIALANPTATKIISRSAYYRGIKPWVREDRQYQTKEG
ncbi:monovalent cation/H(+) antiporter subunit G [Peptococcaceae bacterium]|nr:monovalent cation/H(+) antiporter subunit G [Peptococcaceae bacterium]